MKVTIDENGYVTGWALVGDNGGIDVDAPENLDEFLECFKGYKLVNHSLVMDEVRDESERRELLKEKLRFRRREECYSFINRGQLWYTRLTVKQLAELTEWYTAWLNVTNTFEVPERPSWLTED